MYRLSPVINPLENIMILFILFHQAANLARFRWPALSHLRGPWFQCHFPFKASATLRWGCLPVCSSEWAQPQASSHREDPFQLFRSLRFSQPSGLQAGFLLELCPVASQRHSPSHFRLQALLFLVLPARKAGFLQAFQLPALPAILGLQGVCLPPMIQKVRGPSTHTPSSLHFPGLLARKIGFLLILATSAPLLQLCQEPAFGSRPERKEKQWETHLSGLPSVLLLWVFTSFPVCHLFFTWVLR